MDINTTGGRGRRLVRRHFIKNTFILKPFIYDTLSHLWLRFIIQHGRCSIIEFSIKSAGAFEIFNLLTKYEFVLFCDLSSTQAFELPVIKNTPVVKSNH